MNDGLRQTVERVNARLAFLLEEARGALRDEREFAVENVRQLRATIQEMDPIVAASHGMRHSQSEIANLLDVYKTQLRELQATITQIRVTLLLRRSQMEASRAHVQSVSQWTIALRQTR